MSKANYNTYHPPGFQTVNSYLFVENPQELIQFLVDTFDAEEKSRTMNPNNGDIANVILQIGTSCFMISQARGEFLNMRTSFYLYTEDVDALHQRAIQNGAKLVFSPEDMDYGDRQSGIVDPSGNYWWISKRLEKTSY